MPGLLYHLACGNLVCKSMSQLEYEPFMLGNLIPDLAQDKFKSHYRIKHFSSNWKVPDLVAASRNLLYKNDPVLAGVYCHLLLDNFFIDSWLSKNYQLSKDDAKVMRTYGCSEVWPVETFLSEQGLYGCYSKFNLSLITDGYIPDYIFNLKEQPPLTGFSCFDERSDRNWRKELEKYLANPITDAPEIISLNELKWVIETGANLCSRILTLATL